jgi:hypothetical protein
MVTELERRGKQLCFEISKINFSATKYFRIKKEYCYLITSVYANDADKPAFPTSQSVEYYGACCSIENLVDRYIKLSLYKSYGKELNFPVRNMLKAISSDAPYKKEAARCFEPLKEEDMVEFMRILLSKSPEIYHLSFSD